MALPDGKYIISHALYPKNDEGELIFLGPTHKTLVELVPQQIIAGVGLKVIWEVKAVTHDGHDVYTITTIIPIIKDGIETGPLHWLDVHGHSTRIGTHPAVDKSHAMDKKKYPFQLWYINRDRPRFVFAHTQLVIYELC